MLLPMQALDQTAGCLDLWSLCTHEMGIHPTYFRSKWCDLSERSPDTKDKMRTVPVCATLGIDAHSNLASPFLNVLVKHKHVVGRTSQGDGKP